MKDVQKKAVTEKEAHLRLDRCLQQWFPMLSQGQIQKWIRTGQLRVDGKRVKASLRVNIGQVVRIPPMYGLKDSEKPPKRPLQAREGALIRAAVIDQDEEVIVLNKPFGLAVQGGTKTYHHIDRLLDAFKDEQHERPRLVHRLDKDTTGVLLLARTASAARWLSKAFQELQIKKSYWAVVVGIPDKTQGMITLSLAKQSGKKRERMVIKEENGLQAMTSYKILAQNLEQRLAWLELTPLTGRMHQLRVHCMALGTPILGDGKYGGLKTHGFKERHKMHLHARSLTLPYPNGKVKTFTASLPLHLQETFKKLGFSLEKG